MVFGRLDLQSSKNKAKPSVWSKMLTLEQKIGKNNLNLETSVFYLLATQYILKTTQ